MVDNEFPTTEGGDNFWLYKLNQFRQADEEAQAPGGDSASQRCADSGSLH